MSKVVLFSNILAQKSYFGVLISPIEFLYTVIRYSVLGSTPSYTSFFSNYHPNKINIFEKKTMNKNIITLKIAVSYTA